MSINNNEELSALLRLEVATRIGVATETMSFDSEQDRMNAQEMVIAEAKAALISLENIRGSKFDVEAAYKELMSSKKKGE